MFGSSVQSMGSSNVRGGPPGQLRLNLIKSLVANLFSHKVTYSDRGDVIKTSMLL